MTKSIGMLMIAAVTLCVLLIFAACGGGDDDKTSASEPNPTATPAVVYATATPAPAATLTFTPGVVPTTDSKVLYKAAIERYLNAYIKADIDTLLDSLHPDGPMYPQPAAINQLRATANGNALQGEAVVKDITVVEESADKARVEVTLYMRVDVYSNGNFQEETSYPICELRLKDGKWRLFDMKTQ